MGTCRICGKETGMLLEGDTLCWLCSSRQRVKHAEQKPDPSEKEFEEKRAWIRYPVQIFLRIHHTNGQEIDAVSPGVSVNLSLGGLCIESDPCPECTGYIPGGIHHDCIFSRYDNSIENTEYLSIAICLDETDVVYVNAKAVFVIKRENKELIGICFRNNEQEVMDRIQYIIDTAINRESQ